MTHFVLAAKRYTDVARLRSIASTVAINHNSNNGEQPRKVRIDVYLQPDLFTSLGEADNRTKKKHFFFFLV